MRQFRDVDGGIAPEPEHVRRWNAAIRRWNAAIRRLDAGRGRVEAGRSVVLWGRIGVSAGGERAAGALYSALSRTLRRFRG